MKNIAGIKLNWRNGMPFFSIIEKFTAEQCQKLDIQGIARNDAADGGSNNKTRRKFSITL